MIFALGCDIVELSRIARLDAAYGLRFRARFLHPAELLRLQRTPLAAQTAYLASRWAAKEALHKALRPPSRLPFPDMELAATRYGAPFFRMHGAVAARAAALGLRVSVSLSHERSAAVAFVVAEREGGTGANEEEEEKEER